MHRSSDDPRGYARRLTVAMSLALLLHASVLFLPLGQLRGVLGLHSGAGVDPLGAQLGAFTERALLGSAVNIAPPTPVSPSPESRSEPKPPDLEAEALAADEAEAQPEVEVDTVERARKDVAAASLESEIATPSSAPSAAAAAGDPRGDGANHAGEAAGAGAAGAGLVPLERALQPRVLKYPDVPIAVVKRKIDDFVLLQARVGVDGQVLDVRVLRSITNCDECTRSAVEAVRQYQYGPQATELWTTPFDLRFSYRR